jgi:hypothetical protein
MKHSLEQFEKLTQSFRTGYLISGFIKKTLTWEEAEELDDWILASEENMQLFEDLTDERKLDDFLKWYAERETEQRLKEVKQRIKFEKPSTVISFWRYAVAACIIVAIGIGAYTIFFENRNIPTQEATAVRQDILPGSMAARLTLPDGKMILLKNHPDTFISNNVQIKNGEIIYAIDNNHGSESSLHEITIPRKGFYSVRLPDGSKVWLNSESSIRYPAAFVSNERRVTVTGETYFEVAKDPSRPFIVTVKGIEVRALGTAFNINAYPDEEYLGTTLVQGSIRVSNSSGQVVVKPGQQVRSVNGNLSMVDNIETAPITAWTENKFKLKNASIKEVMRLVERWYDARIVYQDNVDFHFNGTIDRDVPVSELLQLLEATGHVHFEINGTAITVKK